MSEKPRGYVARGVWLNRETGEVTPDPIVYVEAESEEEAAALIWQASLENPPRPIPAKRSWWKRFLDRITVRRKSA